MNRLDAIRQREQAATPGPWRWGGNLDQREVYLSTVDRGRIYIMRFVRWGMRVAQPAFQNRDPAGWWMVDANDLAVREQPYRGDIKTIDHPDAAFIAHARADVPLLLAAVEAAREVLASHRAGFWSPAEFGALEAALAPLLEPVE